MACCLIIAYLAGRAWDAILRLAISLGLRKPLQGRAGHIVRDGFGRRTRVVSAPVLARKV